MKLTTAIPALIWLSLVVANQRDRCSKLGTPEGVAAAFTGAINVSIFSNTSLCKKMTIVFEGPAQLFHRALLDKGCVRISGPRNNRTTERFAGKTPRHLLQK